jgi:hypothetical protein
MTNLKIIGAPHLFLNKRFPDWKDDHKTHMVPPAFVLKNKGSHQIGIKSSAPIIIIDKGERGEAVVYNLLQQLGNANEIGMFVVRGFELSDLKKWKKVVKCQDFIVPNDGEFDFVIFHHKLGIISLEVKSYREIKDAVPNALYQLEVSKQVIMKFATYEGESHIDLPHKKVFAMPFTRRCEFDRAGVKDDIIILYEEDCQSVKAFQEWWQGAIETPTARSLTPDAEAAYEMALSYTLMIRHLYPVTETEYVSVVHQSLSDYSCHKYPTYVQILQNDYPNFWRWCLRVLYKKDSNFDFGNGGAKELKKFFIESHFKILKTEDNLMKVKVGVTFINKLLNGKDYISGDKPSKIDEVLVDLYARKYFLFYDNILRFINTMRKMQTLVVEQGLIEDSTLLQKHPFLKLKSIEDFNTLDRFLSKSSFVYGDKPCKVDLQLFEILTSQMAVNTNRLGVSMVLTTDQLIVYEGPQKQLIIGPPGSGKTDLLLNKVKELEMEIRRSKIGAKILFIIPNGSTRYSNTESLFFCRIKGFFKKSSIVEVITLTLEEESATDMESSVSQLKELLASNVYVHAFIDEYWIGSKPAEHKIILDLVDAIPGYVWITSVFDYSIQQKHADRIAGRTGPLLEKLKEKGGVVSRITTVLRAGNSVINLERGYSAVYSNRSYLYGTRCILGHSLEGVAVTWMVQDDVSNMYSMCAEVVDRTVRDAFSIDEFRRDKLTLNPQDILVVNFAIRMDVNVERPLEELFIAKNIPFQSLGENPGAGKFKVSDAAKVMLLQSLTRDASSYLDGVEWPMVIVILPSSMLLNTAKLAKGAQSLRNYDPYISFFRTMVKLVIISDKWRFFIGCCNKT